MYWLFVFIYLFLFSKVVVKKHKQILRGYTVYNTEIFDKLLLQFERSYSPAAKSAKEWAAAAQTCTDMLSEIKQGQKYMNSLSLWMKTEDE